MPRWVWVALLVAVAAWGWRRTAEGRARGPDEIVAVNHTGRDLERLTIAVAGRRTGVSSLASGRTVRLPLRSERDGRFRLAWRMGGTDDEGSWEGGRYTHGPLRMRHRFELIRGGGVVWRSERLPARATRKPR
jgi:hypothetical protein